MAITKAEHIRWCKQRALEYLPNDPSQALTSMMSDLGKHGETEGLAKSLGPIYLYELLNASASSARRFIEGFCE